jgi:hypothetical protein
MKTYPMRCKHCGSLLEAKGGAWQRFVHGATARVACSHCSKSTTRMDAEAMGTCLGARIEALEGEMHVRVKALPVVTPEVAARHMNVSEDSLRSMPGLDTLCSYVLHMFRPVILEQAHGRDIQLAIVGVGGSGHGHHGGGEAAVAVLGLVEDEKGVRQWEAMIARVGPMRFVVHATAAEDGPVGEPSQRPEQGPGRAGDSGGAGSRGPVSPAGDAPVISAAG